MVKVRISDAYISFYDGEGTQSYAQSYARFAPYSWTARAAWKDYARSARIWKREV